MSGINFTAKSAGKYSLTSTSVWVGGVVPGTTDTAKFSNINVFVDLTGSLSPLAISLVNANIALDGTITAAATSGNEATLGNLGTLTINSGGTLTGDGIVQIGNGTSAVAVVEVFGSLGASDIDLTEGNALLEVAPSAHIDAPIIFQGGNLLSVNGSGTAAAGTIALAGGATLASNAIVLAKASTDIQFLGGVSGTGGLIINGTLSGGLPFVGTVELDGPNSFAGGVALNAGTLLVGNNQGLGTGTLDMTGGALLFSTSETIVNALTIAPTVNATIEVAHGQTVTLAPTTAPLFDGFVTIGDGTNDGTVVFALGHGIQNSAAGFVIEAGTVRLMPGATNSPLVNGSANTFFIGSAATYDLNGQGDAAGDILSSGLLTDTGAAAIFAMFNGVIAGTIAGAVQFNIAAGHAGILLGDNEATQATTIGTGGVLQLGSGSVAGTIAGDITLFGVLDVAGATEDLGGRILGSSAGTLVAQGAGTLTLTNNDAVPTVIIGLGALQVGAGGTAGALQAATVGIAAGSQLIFDRADGVAFAGTVGGAGTVIQAGVGTLTLNANNSFAGGVSVEAGMLALGQEGAAGVGNILLTTAGGVGLELALGVVTLDNTIEHFHTGDVIVAGLTYSNQDSLDFNDGTLSIFRTGIGTLSTLLFDLPGATTGDFTLSQDIATGQLAIETDIACFTAGTRIATTRGEVAVESLRVGDRVRRAADPKRTRTVQWIGRRRVDCRRHPRPQDVMPVRVSAHAFAPGVPARDVVLSPDHAVWTDGVLIPVRYLLNGATIRQEHADGIEYFHVELTRHDALLAEGLPCESYLDTGNRSAFAGGAVMDAHPDFARRVWQADGFAPLAMEGEALAAVRSRLIARLPALGYVITEDAALSLLADGVALEPQRDGASWLLALPADARRLAVCSRVMCPADLDAASDDRRPVGVALRELRIDGARVKLADRRLLRGWHAPESGLRWSDGAGEIDVSGAAVVELRFGAWPRYVVASKDVRAA